MTPTKDALESGVIGALGECPFNILWVLILPFTLSFGPGSTYYQAFACYDLLNNGKQKLSEYGVWTADNFGMDAKGLGMTHLNLSQNLIGGTPYQSGALFSYDDDPEDIILRVGVSFVSADQACTNAVEEIGSRSFEEIVNDSGGLWNAKLGKIEIDLSGTPADIIEMLYTSLYRASLTPVSIPLAAISHFPQGKTEQCYSGRARRVCKYAFFLL